MYRRRPIEKRKMKKPYISHIAVDYVYQTTIWFRKSRQLLVTSLTYTGLSTSLPVVVSVKSREFHVVDVPSSYRVGQGVARCTSVAWDSNPKRFGLVAHEKSSGSKKYSLFSCLWSDTTLPSLIHEGKVVICHTVASDLDIIEHHFFLTTIQTRSAISQTRFVLWDNFLGNQYVIKCSISQVELHDQKSSLRH